MSRPYVPQFDADRPLSPYEQAEAEYEEWEAQQQKLSPVSPEAWWATKAWMAARGFD